MARSKATVTAIAILVTSILFTGLFLGNGAKSYADTGKEGIPLIQPGDSFPAMELETPKVKVYREYLGIPDKPVFLLKEVQAEVLIVEFLNKYCYHCQQQAYLMNRLYRAIEKDPQLKGKVKMLGIGVGNNRIQLEHFRQEKKIPFPLIPDKDFTAFEGIGYPGGTPFTLIVKREDGKFVVKDAHLEVIEGHKAYLEKVRKVLEGETVASPEKRYASAYASLNPGLTDEAIKAKITDRLKERGIVPQEISPLELKGLPKVFMIKLEKGGKLDVWFAALGSEGKVCDICHDIHFIYIFDHQGLIRDFIPIHVTKFGNKPFEETDVEKIRKALVGRNVTTPIQYNPDTDAVSSASMTSALIFKSIKKGTKIFEVLKKEGYIQ